MPWVFNGISALFNKQVPQSVSIVLTEIIGQTFFPKEPRRRFVAFQPVVLKVYLEALSLADWVHVWAVPLTFSTPVHPPARLALRLEPPFVNFQKSLGTSLSPNHTSDGLRPSFSSQNWPQKVRIYRFLNKVLCPELHRGHRIIHRTMTG